MFKNRVFRAVGAAALIAFIGVGTLFGLHLMGKSALSSLNWDLYGTNALIKGFTRMQGAAFIDRNTDLLSGNSKSGTGYIITGLTGFPLFEIDPSTVDWTDETDNCPICPANSGATVEVRIGGVTNYDGAIFGIRNMDSGSGATPPVIVLVDVAGVTVYSGVTVGGRHEDKGDIGWYQYVHNSGESFYPIAEYKND